MEKQTPQQMQKDLVESGVASTMDEAAHMLVDMGEIDSNTHADLLSKEERDRIYG